jgi:hypothetical protein
MRSRRLQRLRNATSNPGVVPGRLTANLSRTARGKAMAKQYAKYEASPGSPPGKPRNGNNAKPAASAAKECDLQSGCGAQTAKCRPKPYG